MSYSEREIMGGMPLSRDAWTASSVIVAQILLRISAWKGETLGKLDGSRWRPMLIAVRINVPTEIHIKSPTTECVCLARMRRHRTSTLARLRRDLSGGVSSHV